MDVLQSKIALKVNPKVFKKDPLSSELGNKIVGEGICLMEELGFEGFTFRKLAAKIGSTEASVYRYFENKHNLLAYITMWYWGWMEYKLVLRTLNIESPEERLKRAIRCVTETIDKDNSVSHIDEVKLHHVVIIESSKVYMCKTVDDDNESGFFLSYKSLVQRVADIILEIKPQFKYPHMLVSTIMEGAHHQRFFADHLPRLTDVVEGEDAVITFYTQLAERELRIEK